VLRRRFRHAAIFAAAMLPAVLGWMWWCSAHRLVTSDILDLYYTDYFRAYLATVAWGDLPRMLWFNIDAMLHAFGRLLIFDVSDADIAKIMLQVLGVGSIVGLVRLVRQRGWSSYILFALLSAPMLLFWNFKPNERFLAGFTPLFLLGAYTELQHLSRIIRKNLASKRTSDRNAARVIGAAVLLLIAFGCWRSIYATTVHFPMAMIEARRELAVRREFYEEISRSTSPGATFVTSYDALLYLYTGRRACKMIPPTYWLYRSDLDSIDRYYAGIREFARERNLEYILLTPQDFGPTISNEVYARIVDAVNRDASWELVRQRGSTYLFHKR
jgi:hypothetical protein